MKKNKIYNDKNIKPKEIIELYISVGWGIKDEYDEPSIRIMIFNTSSIFYCRNEKGKLIGMVRIFSDFIVTTYIAEIIVRPEYQKKGIGKYLIETVIRKFKNTGIYLDTLPGIEGFAEKCGFKKQKNMSVFSKKVKLISAFSFLPFASAFTFSPVFSPHNHR
ncbi:MAG: GNAT family N-acetyltransferase [Ignavibacteria bacterium]|nr:GNAT family N-acetyltransferase [Ignavibacteria bacterium]